MAIEKKYSTSNLGFGLIDRTPKFKNPEPSELIKKLYSDVRVDWLHMPYKTMRSHDTL